MKTLKYFAILAVALLISNSVLNAQFRNTKWGMTKEEVKSAEDAKLVREQGNTLLFQDMFTGMPMYIQYIFPTDRDALARARYFLGEDHENKNTYIDDYQMVQDQLKEKYGDPHTDTVVWKDKEYKGQKSKYGKALSNGDMNYITQWDAHNTKIREQLWGDSNGEIQLVAQYTSKKYGPLLK